MKRDREREREWENESISNYFAGAYVSEQAYIAFIGALFSSTLNCSADSIITDDK